MKVLVVDDQKANQIMLTGLLESFGHQVVCANNGCEALEVFKTEQPHLVLLDVMMPEMDGFETAPRLRVFNILCQPSFHKSMWPSSRPSKWMVS
ncbi:response regulator receiver domain-containing protein [Idiomarina fontislapidosi]|uniref:response regulator n=1 Tax=Idiomarina fontislapidosi TaxID=263723 RepID=UPI000D8B9210|nr:response regulator [Idiomarina fontislapidosi]PYE32135.1 response regulator receiver domain-containing protein [Idiomarina fontislapidosi]